MDKFKITTLIRKIMTIDTYYKKLRDLGSDVDFFLLYMKREAKSEFRFDLRISHLGSYRAFNDIWKKHGYYRNDLEKTFAEYILLKAMITDIYEETGKYTREEYNEFFDYFEQYQETFVNDYITDFIGCSMGCSDVSRKIENIRNE